jgi:hypothetical protein
LPFLEGGLWCNGKRQTETHKPLQGVFLFLVLPIIKIKKLCSQERKIIAPNEIVYVSAMQRVQINATAGSNGQKLNNYLCHSKNEIKKQTAARLLGVNGAIASIMTTTHVLENDYE